MPTPRRSRAFGSSAAHQRLMMANLAASLFAAEAIVTTEAKAKALRPVAGLLPSVADGKENRVYRLPVGVVGVISAFNFPFLVTMKTVAPALALGNAVVVKPHQHAPVAGGGLVARIFEDAGLPPGLLNIVITDSAEIGDSFIQHPVPKVISFTGSDRVGRHVAAVAAAAGSEGWRRWSRCSPGGVRGGAAQRPSADRARSARSRASAARTSASCASAAT